MSKENIAETIAIQKTFNNIHKHFSEIFPVAKKVVKEFPKSAGNLGNIVKHIEKLGVLKPVSMECEVLSSTDPIECLSYIQQIGETAELDINTNLDELKQTVKDEPYSKSHSTYDFANTLYQFYQYGVGNIYSEVKNILFPSQQKNNGVNIKWFIFTLFLFNTYYEMYTSKWILFKMYTLPHFQLPKVVYIQKLPSFYYERGVFWL